MQNQNEAVKAQDVPNKVREFSDAEIKARLKNNSKGDLIKIIVNLSKVVDTLKDEIKDLKHFKDTKLGLFATDSKEVIDGLDEDVKAYFWEITDGKK